MHNMASNHQNRTNPHESATLAFLASGRRDWRHHTKDAERAIVFSKPKGRPVGKWLRYVENGSWTHLWWNPRIRSRENLQIISHLAGKRWSSVDSVLRRFFLDPNDGGTSGELPSPGDRPNQGKGVFPSKSELFFSNKQWECVATSFWGDQLCLGTKLCSFLGIKLTEFRVPPKNAMPLSKWVSLAKSGQ